MATDVDLKILSLGILPDTNLEEIKLSGNTLKNTLPLAQAVWRAPKIQSIHFGMDGCMDRKATLAFAYIKEVRDLDCDLPGYNDDIMRQLAMEKKERTLRYLEPVQFYPEQGTLNLNFSTLEIPDSERFFSQTDGPYKDIDKLHLKNITFYLGSFNNLTAFLTSKVNMIEFYTDSSKLPAKYTYKLLESLKGNTALKKLSLKGNEIGVKAAQSLKRLLQRTTVLEELDLSKIDSTLMDIKVIAEGLRENKSLKALHLHQHNLKSFIYWLAPFWHHPTLEKVNCDYFGRIPLETNICEADFAETLKNGRHENRKIWEKVTAVTLAYIKKHKNAQINFRYGIDEKCLSHTEAYTAPITEFWRNAADACPKQER